MDTKKIKREAQILKNKREAKNRAEELKEATGWYPLHDLYATEEPDYHGASMAKLGHNDVMRFMRDLLGVEGNAYWKDGVKFDTINGGGGWRFTAAGIQLETQSGRTKRASRFKDGKANLDKIREKFEELRQIELAQKKRKEKENEKAIEIEAAKDRIREASKTHESIWQSAVRVQHSGYGFKLAIDGLSEEQALAIGEFTKQLLAK